MFTNLILHIDFKNSNILLMTFNALVKVNQIHSLQSNNREK